MGETQRKTKSVTDARGSPERQTLGVCTGQVVKAPMRSGLRVVGVLRQGPPP